jgi:hypothetical protein
MSTIAAARWFAAGLFVGMLVLLELGRHLRRRHHARHGASAGEGLGAVQAAVFGLLGLLLAFTFSGAASRFDARRQLVVEEANAIGTAYLRLDLLPVEHRGILQQRMRDYVDARLALYAGIHDSSRVRTALARGAALQKEIWSGAVAAEREAAVPQVAALLLPALNEMFDLASTRLAATKIHPPAIIYGLLGVVALLCALLAGYGMGPGEGGTRLHMLALAAILAITVYVIVDLEYPRLGLFQITDFDQQLVEVRAGMR